MCVCVCVFFQAEVRSSIGDTTGRIIIISQHVFTESTQFCGITGIYFYFNMNFMLSFCVVIQVYFTFLLIYQLLDGQKTH